jgi:hypothetical protein
VSINGVRVQSSPREYRLLQELAQYHSAVGTHRHLPARMHDSHDL